MPLLVLTPTKTRAARQQERPMAREHGRCRRQEGRRRDEGGAVAAGPVGCPLSRTAWPDSGPLVEQGPAAPHDSTHSAPPEQGQAQPHARGGMGREEQRVGGEREPSPLSPHRADPPSILSRLDAHRRCPLPPRNEPGRGEGAVWQQGRCAEWAAAQSSCAEHGIHPSPESPSTAPAPNAPV